MAKRTKRKMLANGRNADGGKFAMIPRIVFESGAYRALPPSARALLVEMIWLFDGVNNGSLYLSVDDAAARLGFSDTHAALAAFDALQEFGFIEVTKNSYFSVKAGVSSRARCWRLTWHQGPGRKAPTLDFLDREPKPGTREHKRMERGYRALKRYRRALTSERLPVMETITDADWHPVHDTMSVGVSTTFDAKIAANPPIRPTVESSTHIHLPCHAPAYVPLGWMSG